MSFREKSAWIGLLINIAVFGPYFLGVFAPLGRGDLELDFGGLLGTFIGACVLLVVLSIVFNIALAIHDRNQPTDERDRAIEAKAFRVAYYVLVTSCFLAGFALFALGAVSQLPVLERPAQAYALMSQVLLLGLVLAESAHYVTQVVFYRRGA